LEAFLKKSFVPIFERSSSQKGFAATDISLTLSALHPGHTQYLLNSIFIRPGRVYALFGQALFKNTSAYCQSKDIEIKPNHPFIQDLFKGGSKMNRLRSFSFLATLLGGIILLFPVAGQIQAAELRPYSPPIQQQAPPLEPSPRYYKNAPAPSPPPVAPANTLEAYYRKFERDAANLTQPQRDRLMQAFSGRLDSARQNRQWEEVAHYARLIEILSKRR
jgi:hypothetical protein